MYRNRSKKKIIPFSSTHSQVFESPKAHLYTLFLILKEKQSYVVVVFNKYLAYLQFSLQPMTLIYFSALIMAYRYEHFSTTVDYLLFPLGSCSSISALQ